MLLNKNTNCHFLLTKYVLTIFKYLSGNNRENIRIKYFYYLGIQYTYCACMYPKTPSQAAVPQNIFVSL